MTIKHDITQSRLLDVARRLFWRYGLKKVSVQEICIEADISKMTFYRYFENKIELAKAVFERETFISLKKFRDIIQEKCAPGDKIVKIIAMKRERAEGISKDFLKDFYASDAMGLKTYIEEKTKAAWNEMLGEFKQAQLEGCFRRDLNPEFLFYFSQLAGEMLDDDRLTKLFQSRQDLLAEFSNFFAYGVSPKQ